MSPSLFSLYDKGEGVERLTSLPNLVKGLGQKDQQEWMNFIIEAAGINEQIDAFDKVKPPEDALAFILPSLSAP